MYVIANIDVQDRAAFRDYVAQVPAVIQKYRGRYLVRAGTFEIVEGDRKPRMLVVLEFPSRGDALRFYDSADHASLKALRMKSSGSDIVLVDGI